MDGYISEIRLFAANFAPRGWAFCQGQLLPIAQNSALFSLIGTTYGGDGRTTFALPDLRGRVAVCAGNGSGLSPVNLGAKGGAESVTLTTGQIPSHTHSLNCTNATGNQGAPTGNILAGETVAQADLYSNTAPTGAMSTSAIGPAGSGQSHENRQPFLGLNYIICLVGIFPSRS